MIETTQPPSALETTDAKRDKPGSPRAFLAKIDRCKKVREELVKAWTDNVDMRRGKPFHQESDSERVNVNLDWSLTSGKVAQLYSQTPQVYLTPKSPEFQPAVTAFAKRLNDRLTSADVGAAMNESVTDAVNASGIGCSIVSFQASTIKKNIAVDPNTGAPLNINPAEIPQIVEGLKAGVVDPAMVRIDEVDDVIDRRFADDRFSPSDLLWDVDFTGSNFDHSDWIGRSDRMLWSLAMIAFGLTEDQKEKVCGEKEEVENLRGDGETDPSEEQVVEYDEVFCWAHRFDPTEKYFKKIRRLVFVHGIKDPVIDEPWKGQLFNEETRTYAGACRFPIQVLTLTYISDDAIPPSDTAIGRPQVFEMIETRTEMLKQRKRSQPMRWANTSIVDPMVIDNINRGEMQNVLPIQGNGERALGEVARAAFPPENWEFERIINSDLERQWGAGGNQNGSQAARGQSATEANIVEQNFQTRVGQTRARVAAYFLAKAEVMAGLIALHDDLQIEGWDTKQLAGEFVYFIRPDSTVLLDANQRIDKLMKALNLTGQSGFVNPKPIITEIIALSGIETEGVIIDPTPPEEKPNMSFRFGGAADLMNPLVIALMLKYNMMATPDDLRAALNLMDAAGIPVNVIPQDPAESGLEIPPTEDELEAEKLAQQAEGEGGGGAPAISPQDAAKGKEWGLMPRITKRVEDF